MADFVASLNAVLWSTPTKALAAPIKAIAHIQNTAPGPPNAIAVATPAMFPVPTRPDSAIDNAWKDETPASELLPLN